MYKIVLVFLVACFLAYTYGQTFQYSTDWGKNGKRFDYPAARNSDTPTPQLTIQTNDIYSGKPRYLKIVLNCD
jgi:hypothetical protein